MNIAEDSRLKMKSKVEPNEEQDDHRTVNALSTPSISQQTPNSNGIYGGKKIDMSVFNGDDPKSWIYQPELYFSMFAMSKQEKLWAARLSLEGRALR